MVIENDFGKRYEDMPHTEWDYKLMMKIQRRDRYLKHKNDKYFEELYLKQKEKAYNEWMNQSK